MVETFTAMIQPITENTEITVLGTGVKVGVYELNAKGLYTRF